MGNLQSVKNAFLASGAEIRICKKPEELASARKIVLPGVGGFGDAMQNLHQLGWSEVLEKEVREKGKPFLGICVGLQLLSTTSMEYGSHSGLNWIPGIVDRIPDKNSDLRIPHIGWNDVKFVYPGEGMSKSLEEIEIFYFVHSYILKPEDSSVIKGSCDYGIEFAACIEKDNIWATQFHPEKSHKAGLQILNNFIALRN